jgi:hypothetical protein
MSYDIFCYRSTTGTPDEDDANCAIEIDFDKYSNAADDPDTKLAILKALVLYNPKLKAVDHKYGLIANLPVETLRSDPSRFHHIEVNLPENAQPIRLTIYNNHVYINFPYWHDGSAANQLLDEVIKYITIIRNTAGYFVFDPQIGEVFDPNVTLPDFLKTYTETRQIVKDYAAQNNYRTPVKKPWWKFW